MVPSSEPYDEDEQESAISVPPPPHTSAAALVTIGKEHVDGSQVTETKFSSEHTDSSGLGECRDAQAAVPDAESAILVSPLPHTLGAALVIVGNKQGRGAEPRVTLEATKEGNWSIM